MSMKRQRDGSYLLRYYENGTKASRQRQETLRGVTFEEAKRIHRKRLEAASVRRARGENGGGRLTVADLGADYLEVQGKKMAPAGYVRALQIFKSHIEPALGEVRIEALRPIDVERYF